MIAKLTGVLDSVAEGFIILDVNGVGYRVFCSAKTIGKLPPRGGNMSLMIETQVREDHIHLIGFADATEQQMFGYLSTVQGVGAKVALAILSALSPSDIQMAVMTGDSKAFTRASGVGPKLGVRIVTELKGKLGNLGVNEAMNLSETTGGQNVSVMAEAVSALTNLGYSRTEAGLAVSAVMRQNPEASVSDAIRLSLREIGKGAV
ncbi:MAG: Holliday junction branch migration protein RuvA [Alphaproteobacteria bacterium]|nr:Holliday junction branch migration protein RuvA [Alphaproteobacteria bacterium]